MDFPELLSSRIEQVEAALRRLVPAEDTRPARLHEAIRYSLLSGGKRLRPVLVVTAAELFPPLAGKASDPLPAAVAVECIHTYSLIHDDLPCMDDDDLRRGRPTLHRAFDEATAVLAGDALLTHAFFLLATAYGDKPALAAALVRELGEAAGSRRLIGGQVEDLQAEQNPDATASDLEYIHRNKTAAMIEASLVMGGLLGSANDHQVAALREAGLNLGLAFQVIDDILDATATTDRLGKTAGKDARAGKTTFVRLHGLEESRRFARDFTERALGALASLPGDKAFLETLFRQMLERAN